MSDAALVCGFADPAGAIAGACWRLGGSTGGVLLAGDAVSAAEAEISERDAGLGAKLGAGDASGEVELSELTGSTVLDGPIAGLSAVICSAEVELSHEGKSRSVSCQGHLTRWQEDPLEDSELVRHLALPLGEQGLLIAAALRPPAAAEHGEETVGAWRLDPAGGAEAFAEALLSTQYDGSGRPVRAGLELWPSGEDDVGATRAAGAAIGVAASGRVLAAVLNTSSEGRTGIGSYLIGSR